MSARPAAPAGSCRVHSFAEPLRVELAPELLLPSQLPAGFRKDASLRPEKRLMLAVLEEAVADYQRYVAASAPRGTAALPRGGSLVRVRRHGVAVLVRQHLPGARPRGGRTLRAGLRRWRDAQRARALRGEPVVTHPAPTRGGHPQQGDRPRAGRPSALALVGRSCDSPPHPLVLLTGATGYVGGRLLPVLERAGVRVRCLARRPGVPRRPGRADHRGRARRLPRPRLARPALAGVHTAYYLVHSLGARRVVRGAGPARGATLRRGRTRRGGAAHRLPRRPRRRRRRDCLPTCAAAGRPATRCAPTGVPVVEFRASIILGSGSLSYELHPRAGRATAGHALSGVGADPRPADRHRGRRRLSARRARPAGRARAAPSRSAAPTARRTPASCRSTPASAACAAC